MDGFETERESGEGRSVAERRQKYGEGVSASGQDDCEYAGGQYNDLELVSHL